MARKPKTASSNEPATSIDAAQPALSDTAAPVRRGRKPKRDVSPEPLVMPEPLAMMDSDDAMGGTVDADGGIADPIAAPVRKRPGPKPKQRADGAETAPPQNGAEARPGQTARAPDATLEAKPTADSTPGAEVKARQQPAYGHKAATLETTPDPAASDAAPAGSGQNVASAKPAAHWDRGTDTVRFEWAEIEQTAAQEGPNQAVAKLLMAARAEGANSRWPL